MRARARGRERERSVRRAARLQEARAYSSRRCCLLPAATALCSRANGAFQVRERLELMRAVCVQNFCKKIRRLSRRRP